MKLDPVFGFLGLIAVGCGGATGLEAGEANHDAPPNATTTVPIGGPRDTTPTKPGTKTTPSATPTGTPGRPAPTGPCTNVSGHWSGTWQAASGARGTWDTYWTEDPSGSISGKETVTGTACGSGAALAGHRNGCTITFGLASFGGCSVDFVGTLGGDRMAGSFTVSAGAKDSGNWEGARAP